jgi:hypothetical protein
VTGFESVMPVFSLAGFIWVINYLLPKARREQDSFAIICSLLTALITLFGFFFFSVAIRSH